MEWSGVQWVGWPLQQYFPEVGGYKSVVVDGSFVDRSIPLANDWFSDGNLTGSMTANFFVFVAMVVITYQTEFVERMPGWHSTAWSEF